MTKGFNKITVANSLILTFIGALIIGGMFAYYSFHLGIKPCKGLPTDSDNCGDADFGGIVFLLFGVPIFLTGVIGLIGSLASKYLKHNR